MSAQVLLATIRSTWLHRIAHSMARGADVRTNFEKELDQFFSLLEQAVVTGDPAWLDSILTEWIASPTQSDLEQGKNNVSLLLSKMIEVTNEVARESLTDTEAYDLLTALIPIYTYCLDKAARLEMENRITYISNELMDVQQQLEQLDRTKSSFVSVAAHELKTPLTLIEGYTSMMRDMLDAAGQTQFDSLLVGMNKGVDRLHEIINDMIDVSVIDNDLLSLSFQQITVQHILKLIQTELIESIQERKQTLKVRKFSGIDTWLYADTERLYQALRNVLVNAIKYTPDGGKISVNGRTLPGFIEVLVTDTGIGVAPEHQTAIFEKFAQIGHANLHSSGKTKFKGGGPGLGLPIARGIIEAHGGTIWVESKGYDEEKYPGATFHILIPIRTEEADSKVEKLFPQEANTKEELHGQEIPEPTTPPKERTFLVGVELFRQPGLLSPGDSLTELALLSDTAGLDVVGELTQKLKHPHVETYIGPGKVEELKALAEDSLTQVVIFDDELSPRHQRELEKALGANMRVIDRTSLILDIFAQHANTSEGMLQVELAQYEYYLPRLTRQWTHLARQAGGGAGRGGTGGVGLRGPGETQLEVDRRQIGKRITHLKKQIEKVRAHRERYRAKRKRARLPTVAFVGYTNTGKSTLLNRLAQADVYVANQLFATLDPTTRRVELPGGYQALFTDTVGFIQKLPTTLVAAFHATLEEITEADLLLHLVDISHPNALNQFKAVQQTLEEIGAGHIPAITALNKVDRLKQPEQAQETLKSYPKAVAISGLKGSGLPKLLSLIQQELYETYTPIDVHLPYQQGALISTFHEMGRVEFIEHERGGVHMQGRIPGRLLAEFAPWLNSGKEASQPAENDIPIEEEIL